MFLRTVCLDIMIKLMCMLRTASHDIIHKSTSGGTRVSRGDILFIESNHEKIQISCSERLINSSGMTLEQRKHMPGAIWSSSLSAVSFMCEKQ